MTATKIPATYTPVEVKAWNAALLAAATQINQRVVGVSLSPRDTFDALSGLALRPYRELPLNETRAVSWYTCDCDWTTKFCDENHRATARVPLEVLDAYQTNGADQ